MPKHIALLRGINVGGKNRLAMPALAALFRAAGCTDVRTYIQSGNVLFNAPQALATRVPQLITTAIATRFKLQVPVITRTAAQFARLSKDNPFVCAGHDPSALFVLFLAHAPTRAQVAALDPNRSPGDAFEVRGGHVFFRLSNGAAATKLTTAYFDAALRTVSTARNWRTVTKLHELCA